MVYLLVDTDILIDVANDDVTAQTRLSNEVKNIVLLNRLIYFLILD